jgi:predicted flap endonuclease-1-like 5' DNA nuclease
MLKKEYSKDKPYCKVTFILPLEAARGATQILLIGDFNGWNPDEGVKMQVNKSEYQATLELEAGRAYEFRYLVDGATWVNDWDADDYVPSPFMGIDNSVVRLEAAVKSTIKAPARKEGASKAPGKKEPAAKAASGKQSAPKKAAAPAKDDLKKIEGIGPKIEQLLNAKSIATYGDLSKAKIGVLKAALDEAGPRFRMHDPSTWAKQAKLAAEGKWDELKQWQAELKGGRKA